MDKAPKASNTVVKNDLCTGCGLCVFICPHNALQMHWNDFGFLVPVIEGNCESCGKCIFVCPFNLSPENEVKTENELTGHFLQENTQYHPKIGKYTNIYAGYSTEFRLTSSSGGICTYIFTELLEQGIVDHIFSVRESTEDGALYEYRICSSKDEILAAAKTKYYPVTLAAVMPKIHEIEGKVAIVGVACFIKAIRLAQYVDPELQEKIPFLAGIICGGIKSRFFTEYLASKAGVRKQDIVSPEFRVKNIASPAADYSFRCKNNSTGDDKTIKMSLIGDMWGTGLFKANACDYCDDLTTELSDISIGDAWIKPYSDDGKGTNVIVTRSLISDTLIKEGLIQRKIHVEEITPELFLTSQRGNLNHKHKGLSVRLRRATKRKMPFPPKRFGNETVALDFTIVQLIRLNIRKKSLEIWKQNPDAIKFERAMKISLLMLKVVTRIYHYRSAISKKFKSTAIKNS